MAHNNDKSQFYVAANSHDTPPQANEADPHSKPPGRMFRLRQKLHKYWALEAFASILSLTIFAFIIGILAYYNKSIYGDASSAKENAKKRPVIFTILSFLSALMRAAMLLPVATAIAQLKWSWFRSNRELLDLERFDDAAKGMFGSFKFLLSIRFRSIAALGAALTILALPLDALIQSSVLLPSKLDINDVPYLSNVTNFPFNVTDKTFMPRISFYNEWQTMEDSHKPWPETAMLNAILFGQSYQNGLSNVVEAVTRVNCPTGYCEFPKSQSLAIGSACVDRTDAIRTIQAQGQNSSAYLTLPGTDLQLFYQGANGYKEQIITTKSYTGWPDTEFNDTVYGGIPGPLIVRTAMLLNLWDNYTMGLECALFWRVATREDYLDSTTNFKLNTTGDNNNYTFKAGTNGTGRAHTQWDITPDECFVDGDHILPSRGDFYKENCVFGVGREAGIALQNLLLDDRDGFNGDSWLRSVNADNTSEWTRTNNFITNIYEFGQNDATPRYTFGQLTQMWNNFAFITSFSLSRAPTLLMNGTWQKLNTTGTIYRPIYYYDIEWPRLIMPAIILLSCAGFVLCTAILTRDEYSWRKSALPLLFHGLEDKEKAALGDVRDFTYMKDVAENMKVRLIEHVDAQGARFTTQH